LAVCRENPVRESDRDRFEQCVTRHTQILWEAPEVVGEPEIEVAAAAILRHGRVLAARRTHPADVAGGWELPGGKIDPGETVADAVAREIAEELGCEVELVSSLEGRSPIKPGYVLTAHVARLVAGEPIPVEHDAIRWLSADELDDVDWLPSDRPFLGRLRELLDEGARLPGGNVGGAVRVGRTVRRPWGGWTPAVHALLQHLTAAGVTEVPRPVGRDSWGREVLTFVPGRVIDPDDPADTAADALLADAGRWLRRFHDAVADFAHPGPWRTTPPPTGDQIVCHHDFAPYNAAVSSSSTGPRLVGVFDWDMAGAGRPLDDLAFAAWNWVPLHRGDLGSADVARRLRLLATAYGGRHDAVEVVDHVIVRIQRSIDVVNAGAAAGDAGMVHLLATGQIDLTAARLDELRRHLPALRARLTGGGTTAS